MRSLLWTCLLLRLPLDAEDIISLFHLFSNNWSPLSRVVVVVDVVVDIDAQAACDSGGVRQ